VAVADPRWDRKGDAYRIARTNAQLISAAPDLLRAAKKALECDGEILMYDTGGLPTEATDALERAIKKAEEDVSV